MATSGDQPNHLDIAVLSDVKTAASHSETNEGEVCSPESTLDFDPSPVMSKKSAPDVENPVGTQEQAAIQDSKNGKTATLGSPFPSPKLVAEDNKSVASLEDGEIIEQDLDGAVGASSVTVQEQQEQIDEKAESKLGMSHYHHQSHLLM